MDDFRLKVFITAARTLSFTRTAEQLYISQPAVSKHIGELESRYKVQLFARRGSRLELTDAGRTMLEAAERPERPCSPAPNGWPTTTAVWSTK